MGVRFVPLTGAGLARFETAERASGWGRLP